MKLLTSLFLATLASVSAFAPMQMKQRANMARNARMLGEMDSMCIMNTAAYCVNEDCSLDDIEALVLRLEEQSQLVENRFTEMRSLMAPLLTPRPRAVVAERTALLLSEMDTMCIMNAASYCSEEECSLDDKQGLVNRLAEQSQLLQSRVHEMVSLTRRLRASQRPDDRDVDALMQSIQSSLKMDIENMKENALSGIIQKVDNSTL